ncbi:hypothetical protein KIW84_041474 [Lathyrus oleraceus]|uniref:Uncharacterized protein n=1 Tax=Pisum sativum TaxID=3888 RepID=A0A9D5ALC4_PEA|nr:hypothetical protein KIW84_041474 [Pisum sativum]
MTCVLGNGSNAGLISFHTYRGIVVNGDTTVGKKLKFLSIGAFEWKTERARANSEKPSIPLCYVLIKSKELIDAYRTPSMVATDPFWQQHYVCPEEKSINLASLDGFSSEFPSGTLLPYQLSKDVLQGQWEARYPPFINLYFPKVDSIPRVTTHTFSELVIGFKHESQRAKGGLWRDNKMNEGTS